MATVTAASISTSDSLERFRQEFNTLRSDVSNIQSGALTISNEANNRILTSVSENTFNAESGLTYDGSTFDVSGAVTISGLTTLSGNLVIPNAGNIGSAGDNDAIAIASNGVVTFSQTPVFPDGSLPVVDLDIDGATDIGAALADADLFIVDDGAGGTNRKTAASRIKTYIADVTLTTAAQTNITSVGTLTTLTVDNIIINGTNIGHTSDTDAIAIASNGVVTFSQAPVFPDGSIAVADLDIDGATDIGAAIADADLIIVDDGAGGTNRKATMSRLKTYMGLSAGALALTSLDIDGGTDIGANLADADLLIVDDGAGGTNRKTAMSRVKTYVADVTLTTAAQTNITSVGTLTGLTVNGAVVFNENSADVDFRVESNGNTHMLFVDGGNDNVHIGSSAVTSQSVPLQVGTGQANQIVIKGSGSGFTQGGIIIEGGTDNTPGTRGQGVYYFNEGNDRTYYSGTLYNNGTVWGVGTAAGTSLALAAADNSNAVFTIASNGNVAIDGTLTVGDADFLSKSFESSATDITMDSIHTFSHGLGVRPTLVEVWIKCTDGERNWATGDYLLMAGAGGVGGSIDAGISIQADATNVEVLAGPEIRIHDQSSFNETSITASKWDFVVVAYGGNLG